MWFKGDEVILTDVLLHRTKQENETVLSCCKQCGCSDAEHAVALNIGFFRHVEGYEELLQQKTKLRRGTWLALPVPGAEVRAHGANALLSRIRRAGGTGDGSKGGI